VTLSVAYSSGANAAVHAFDTTRKPDQVARSLRDHPIAGVVVSEVDLAHDALLASVHGRAYIEAIRTGEPRDLAESSELPWDPGIDAMARASVGCAVAAALVALQDGRAGALATGLHHARAERGDGWCTFNGLAVAARTVMTLGTPRVLVLDLDAHCGGGTREILRNDARCRQIDIATDDYDAYGSSDAWTLDLVTDADRYLAVLRSRLDEAVAGQPPSIVLYNAGMDCHESSADGALAGITSQVLRERERMVFSWARDYDLPIAWVLAGGYRSPTLSAADVVDLHRLTVEAAASASA